MTTTLPPPIRKSYEREDVTTLKVTREGEVGSSLVPETTQMGARCAPPSELYKFNLKIAWRRVSFSVLSQQHGHQGTLQYFG